MHVGDELKPGRDFAIALTICALAGVVIFSAASPGFPVLHTILNTGIALATAVLALLFWDLGWRTGAPRVHFLAIILAVTGVLEILHVLAALEPSTSSELVNDTLRRWRSGTWAPPAYLLPLGMGLLLWISPVKPAGAIVIPQGESKAPLDANRFSRLPLVS